MSNLSDKVAYLRGLAEGMKLSAESDEGRLITEIIGVLGEVSRSVSDLEEAQGEINEYVDSIDEDLSELEQRIDELDGLDEDDDAFDEDDDDEDDDEDAMFLECVCPACKAVFYIGADEVGEDVQHVCPHCGEHVHVETVESDDIPIAHLVDEDEDDGDDDE